MTAAELIAILDEVQFDTPEVRARFNNWLERGDGVAVYRNVDLGHPDLGHRKFVSYGSFAAQLEAEVAPERLPDIGGEINWRYTLEGTYKGELLPVEVPA